MYDPIDGGPTLVADLADTVSGRHRIHGRATVGQPGPTDALVSVAGIDRFRVTRASITAEPGALQIDEPTASALGVETDALLTAVLLDPSPADRRSQPPAERRGRG
jgi:arginine/ornithine N-succinyltransferase beta subunit